MNKNFLIYILIIFLVVGILIYFNFFRITGYFIGFGGLSNATWFNVTWYYRIKIEVNSSTQRTNWPIEIKLNFSDLIPYGTLDKNSTRLFEYDNSGKLLYEVPHQVDFNDDIGELVFILNGTTQANQKRIFYLYYDIIEHGLKGKETYPTNLSYFVDSGNLTVNVNTTNMAYYLRTEMGNGLSGIQKVVRKSDEITIVEADITNKPVEYMEYTNGTNTFSFNFSRNIKIVPGSIRLTIIQEGDEYDINSLVKTNLLKAIKKYYFYTIASSEISGGMFKLEQIISNPNSFSVQRNSTPAGAVALDLNRTFTIGGIEPTTVTGNKNNPFSFFRAGTEYENLLGGIININQTNTTNFFATNETETLGRIGIHLNQTDFESNSIVSQKSLIYFGAYGDPTPGTEFENIRVAISNPEIITINKPEIRYVVIDAITNATIYNRNETVLLIVNITEDILNISKNVNATFDMGTLDSSDDTTIILYNTNDKVFANFFVLRNDSVVGEWNVNISVYNEYGEYINSTIIKFNVTDILNVEVNVLNKNPIEGFINYANIDVKNFRNDSNITGANITCSLDSQLITDFIDFNNGTYQVNFTTPPIGFYVLTCNATKNGNLGFDNDTFTSQAAKTSLNITSEPAEIELNNISFNYGQSFSLSLNVSNIGNGIAYNSNISINLPLGWNSNSSLEFCGDIHVNSFCIKGFLISAPQATSPNDYYINFTSNWTNPDGTLNFTIYSFKAKVLKNPLIEVFEDLITGIAPDGLESYISNFTVLSIGNYKLENISFSCISGIVCSDFSLKFVPENVSNLTEGYNISIAVNATIPILYQAGTYNGTINVSAANDKFDLVNISITIPPTTKFSIDLSPSSFIADNITYYTNQSFSFSALVKNIGNSSGKNVNISLQLPTNWISNSTLENCGNVISGYSCLKHFNITIASNTKPGIYFVNVRVDWENLNGSLASNTTLFTVNVTANPLLDVLEDVISGNAMSGLESYISNFTVLSIGNYKLENISFSCISGIVCSDFALKFVPENVSNLTEGYNISIAVNATIPILYQAGTYNGTINVSAANDKFDLVNISITILESRVWNFTPNLCIRATYPSEGVACEVFVRNLGNTYINFNITPEFGNYTRVNVTNFTLLYNTTYVFSVLYNVTDAPEGFYDSIFLIDAVESDAFPDNDTLLVKLVPFSPPLIDLFVFPKRAEQNDSINIIANVTDTSGAGLKFVKANITYPNFTIVTYNMSFNGSHFILLFNDTMQIGNYSVIVFAEDNIGNFNSTNSSFFVQRLLKITLSTFSTEYIQGDLVSIFYKVLNISNDPIPNVTVYFRIYNPNKTLVHYSFYNTSTDGIILPIPTFQLTSDAIVGNYTLNSISLYEEAIKEVNYSFLVSERTVTVAGLFADISTAVVWYPENILIIGLLTYNGEGSPVDVDTINLTVYDPLGNVFFSINESFFRRESKGFYSYRHFIPITAPTGMYLAVANVSKDKHNTMKLQSFRIARGGPYDLRVTPLENEVEQNDYLDFLITIINMGEISQDVFVEYWTSDISGNITFFKASEFFLVNSLENKTVARRVPIYLSQQPGTYLINVKMVYDSQVPPLIVNASFIVKERRGLIPGPGNISQPIVEVNITGGVIELQVPFPQPTANLTSKLIIEKFEKYMPVARGYSRMFTVVVKNIGETELSNVTLDLIGIPFDWFNITPTSYVLRPNATGVFILTLNIPKNANITKMGATLIASSNLVSDSKDVEIEIFKSLKEILEKELSDLEEEYADLFVKTKIAKKEGRDVSIVEDLLKEIRKKLDEARKNLNEGNYETGLKNIEQAKILIERAKDILSKLELPVKAIVFPKWLIAVISLSLFSIFIFYKLTKKRKIEIKVPTASIIKAIEKIKREKDIEAIKEEREKLLRALRALERERETLSRTAYESMKKNLEERLKRIEKELKEA